jgi:hypothetical protein
MPSLATVSNVDALTGERARAITPFGFTARQARFVVTVMLHSGVFVGRQYAAFAGITYGQKVHDFVEKLCARRLATATAFGATGRIRLFHVHHKPLYAAVGEPDNRNRKPIGLGRAVERLILDGVLSDPSLMWLGTERDKRRHFIHHLGNRLEPHQYPRLVFGKEPNTTTRFFPDKLPIGIEPAGRRHVFLYLVTSQTPMDFRQFLLRHGALLSAVGWWTIRVLVPRARARDTDAFEAAAYEQLARPLHPTEADDLRDLFRRRQAAGRPAAEPAHEASSANPKAFREPRLVALYRRWLEAGDSVLWLARSPVFRDALERREARIECVSLSHAYAYLSSLAGSS